MGKDIKGKNKNFLPVLLVDDDEDDCLLLKDAFRENQIGNEVRCVRDGAEAMDYLLRRRKYREQALAPNPALILLDLNMPRMDGRATLKEIKSHPDLRSIPVVVLTTSREEKDIVNSYAVGANSYITKPVTFAGLVQAMKVLGKYWFEIVELPRRGKAPGHE